MGPRGRKKKRVHYRDRRMTINGLGIFYIKTIKDNTMITLVPQIQKIIK